MRNFRKLKIWEQGIEIVKAIYLLSENLPSKEKFWLRSQITRAAVSIPSNIAEGCSRNSEIEFKQFLKIDGLTFWSWNTFNYYQSIKFNKIRRFKVNFWIGCSRR